ncbi:hypothetical protein V8F20_002650 [Naviculisporaceae sp. PSN 640]
MQTLGLNQMFWVWLSVAADWSDITVPFMRQDWSGRETFALPGSPAEMLLWRKLPTFGDVVCRSIDYGPRFLFFSVSPVSSVERSGSRSGFTKSKRRSRFRTRREAGRSRSVRASLGWAGLAG